MALRARTPAGQARARRRGEPGEAPSDLRARILAAVPAIAVALFLVIEGGLIFTLGLFVLGCVCMHELYAMYARAHPVRLAGFLFVAAPGFMDPMFFNPPGIAGLPAGVIILVFGGIMMFIGFMLIRRIVDIEV